MFETITPRLEEGFKQFRNIGIYDVLTYDMYYFFKHSETWEDVEVKSMLSKKHIYVNRERTKILNRPFLPKKIIEFLNHVQKQGAIVR